MKKILKIMAFSLSMLFVTPAFSQELTNELSNCMVDNLNGKERRILAKWIFFGIGAHPEINNHVKASDQELKNHDKRVGLLFNRLLTVDCLEQLKSAYRNDSTSIEKSFEVLGRVAMMELTNNAEVNKRMTRFSEFTDNEKNEKMLR